MFCHKRIDRRNHLIDEPQGKGKEGCSQAAVVINNGESPVASFYLRFEVQIDSVTDSPSHHITNVSLEL